MSRIKILDCTLRDGGYINDFNFGNRTIIRIIQKLGKASIDIIECGFLRHGQNDQDKTLFGSIEQITSVIGAKNPNLLYVAMIQVGAIESSELSERSENTIDGIRVTFHETEIEAAICLCKELMKKGYLVFMQPVGTTTYTDSSLLKLIEQMNQLNPYAFYMVDTLGTMYKNDILRMFYLVDNNLNKSITIGFHAHNNLQLAFANAQELMQLNSPRNLIIDSSVFGMGRGAGNLNTELVTHYLNSNFEFNYDNIQILEILDEYIRPLSNIFHWGYDAAYYLASIHKCHPNYASYLLNLQTLHVSDMNSILNSLDKTRSGLFDKEYIEDVYMAYLSRQVDDLDVKEYFKKIVKSRKVLLVAPGESTGIYWDKIAVKIKEEDLFVVSINFIPENLITDTVFISNLKRFSSLKDVLSSGKSKIVPIITSNITQDVQDGFAVINYASYLNENRCILDNAGMMCINFFNQVGAKSLYLAGFDGFQVENNRNYYDQSLYVQVEAERLLEMNAAITEKIKQLRRQMIIEFLTPSLYDC